MLIMRKGLSTAVVNANSHVDNPSLVFYVGKHCVAGLSRRTKDKTSGGQRVSSLAIVAHVPCPGLAMYRKNANPAYAVSVGLVPYNLTFDRKNMQTIVEKLVCYTLENTPPAPTLITITSWYREMIILSRNHAKAIIRRCPAVVPWK
jgi:hypothetical protein